MQSEAARRAGEPSGQGEEASPKGLGGYQLLTQTDARGPAGQVVGDDLDGQPGAVGGEAARGEMVEPHLAMLAQAYLSVIKHQAMEPGEKGAATVPMKS